MKCLISTAHGHSLEEMLRIYYKLKNFNPIVVSESWRLIMIEVENLQQLIDNLKFPLIIDRARKKDMSYGWLIKKHNIKYDITIYDDYIE